ncbi:hypothetical protein BpHYR1_043678 [Brachionus plicatilis]|uniref:Uncharacterized protein n=1 Tax=Brachionus plicatilis TaxID=10195 RepID=A0A3M7RQP1_BRAPC|nr:hypothetical protein BpHYR1_043678 [Brachionus plicatilis]
MIFQSVWFKSHYAKSFDFNLRSKSDCSNVKLSGTVLRREPLDVQCDLDFVKRLGVTKSRLYCLTLECSAIFYIQDVLTQINLDTVERRLAKLIGKRLLSDPIKGDSKIARIF